jgi:hypothetical protein
VGRVTQQRHAGDAVPAVPDRQGVDAARDDRLRVGDQATQGVVPALEVGEDRGLGGGRVGEVDCVQPTFVDLECRVDVEAAVGLLVRKDTAFVSQGDEEPAADDRGAARVAGGGVDRSVSTKEMPV